MVQTPERMLTLEELLQLSEIKPASECINGKMIQKPMPQGKHSTVQGELVPAINAIAKREQIARAYPKLRCVFDRIFGGRSVVPDVSVFLWDRIPQDADGSVANSFLLAPAQTIEILLPEQSTIRVMQNILHYLKHGTQLGLIDPTENLVLVYFPDQRLKAFEVPHHVLPVPAFATDVRLTAGETFGWRME
jgi:Uma2 family endonuclease